jgi:hypothetical protein
MRQRRGCLANLVWLTLFCVAILYTVIAVTAPWAFHIGGRPTPLATWWGSGKLRTKDGIQYPLFVYLYPSSHFSRLRMDGLRPTGGLKGMACLCTSPGVTQQLKLSGTIYGGWLSTEGTLMGFRLLEPKIFDVGQRQGFFDLVGKWQGPELVMDDRGSPGSPFRSGLRIEHASVSLNWSGLWTTCNSACASTAKSP